MSERDYYGIMALLLAAAASLALQAMVLRRHDEDISYLMDNTVTRVTAREAQGG